MTSTLSERIQFLYDQTTSGWVDVWGDHLHHGYYGPDGQTQKDHQQAQEDMISTLLAWAKPSTPSHINKILDVGCGVGGSSRFLANHFSADVEGITLSPVQRDIAQKLSGQRTDVTFTVADANRTSFPDRSFDMVWSLESGEHMPCKFTFLSECLRVLKPGGQLIIATWCSRPEPPELRYSENFLLSQISRAYQNSLTWVPLSHYLSLMNDLPFDTVRAADWSRSVTPFWNAVLRSAVSSKGLSAIIHGGAPMFTGALGGLLMRQGLKQELVRYVVINTTKENGPASLEQKSTP